MTFIKHYQTKYNQGFGIVTSPAVIEVTLEVPFNKEMNDIEDVEMKICNDFLNKIYGVTIAELKELFPERFI